MQLKTASILTTSIALLYIIVNLFTEKEQFKASIHLAIWMQSHSSSILDFFMAFCSFLGYPFLVIVLAIYTFVEPNKFLAYKITFFCVSSGFLNGVLKLLYASPRPWYADEKVLVMECLETDFGRPSGHSMFSIYVGIMFYRSYIYKSEEELLPEVDAEAFTLTPRTSNKDIFGASDNKKRFIFILYVIAVILVGASRVYRGAHSFDQVLLGWSYGILCFHLTVYYLEKPVEKLFSSYYDNWDTNFKRHLLILLLTFFVCLLLPIGIFVMKDGSLDLQPWAELIKSKCGVSDKNQMLVAYSLYSTAFGALSFGILFGILFGTRNVLSRRSVESYSCKKIGIKIMIAFFIVGLFGLAGYMIPVADNPYVIYMLKGSLLLFVVGFFMLAVLPRIYQRFQLEMEELEIGSARTNIEQNESELAI